MNCRFRWCAAPHAAADGSGSHIGDVAQFTGLTVRLSLIEHPGDEPGAAHVRLIRPVGARVRIYDLTPQAAIDLSEIFAGIDVRDLTAICQALYRAGVVLESATQP